MFNSYFSQIKAIIENARSTLNAMDCQELLKALIDDFESELDSWDEVIHQAYKRNLEEMDNE